MNIAEQVLAKIAHAVVWSVLTGAYSPQHLVELAHCQALNRQDFAAEKRRRIAARLAEIRMRTRLGAAELYFAVAT